MSKTHETASRQCSLIAGYSLNLKLEFTNFYSSELITFLVLVESSSSMHRNSRLCVRELLITACIAKSNNNVCK